MKIEPLLEKLVEMGGTDLHFQEGQCVEVRKHGQIIQISEGEIPAQLMGQMFEEFLGPVRWKKYLEKGDADFAFTPKSGQRFRCNFISGKVGMAAVIRAIALKIPTLEQLGAGPVVQQLAESQNGLVVISGHSGTGKTTTAAAMLEHINSTMTKRIFTIEEPIEYLHKNRLSTVQQLGVGKDIEAFENGLAQARTERADVIFVGQFRDMRTVYQSLQAAKNALVFGMLMCTC